MSFLKIFCYVSKYKLYLPIEEELLRELNQEYQALETGMVKEINIVGEKRLDFASEWYC